MQTCPGFYLKSLLESPGNLLEIYSVKFVDTLKLLQQELDQEVLEVRLVAVIQSVYTAMKASTNGPASSWSELASSSRCNGRWGYWVDIILGC